MHTPESPAAPNNLTHHAHYFDDPARRQAFIRHLETIHGLDLTLWHERGAWDRTHYTAFSLFDGPEVVATVNVYSLDLVVNGALTRVGQLSGVGTLPEYRRRGLARWLTERALAWAEPLHEGFYLFASEEARPLYRSAGFVPVQEHITRLPGQSAARAHAPRRLQLDTPADFELLWERAHERCAVSERLGVLNPSLLLFHALYGMKDALFEVPELELVLMARAEAGRLDLFDVIGPEVPPLSALRPFLAAFPHEALHIHFHPDRLDLDGEGERVIAPPNGTHVRAPFRIPEGAVFPVAARA